MKLKLSLLILIAGVFTTLFMPRPAYAICTGCCDCITVRNYIVDEIKKHEKFLENTFWKQYFEPALSTFANQINNKLSDQSTTIGGFLEAQDNIAQRRVLQELSAQTARNYLPSDELCRFASLGMSLSSSEEKARATRLNLIQISQNRQLGQTNTLSTGGGSGDMVERAKDRAARNCDPSANSGRDAAACAYFGEDARNADLDFTQTFDSKPTLDVDFTEIKNAPTKDEQNILSLSNNIFASDLFQRPNPDNLKTGEKLNDARTAYMDMRSLIAKRSVAENSFNTLISLKARGTGMDGNKVTGSTKFITGVLKELGLDDASALAYLGKAPSYDAQMEVLTKKVYQSPSFYVNLMDNPANVERQYAAMQSFGLMQQRDIFDSILRSEMLLSLIVELEVSKYQDQVQGTMDKIKK